MAAATVAAPLAQDVGAEVGSKLQSLGTFGDNLAVGLAKGAVDEAAYAAFTGGTFSSILRSPYGHVSMLSAMPSEMASCRPRRGRSMG